MDPFQHLMDILLLLMSAGLWVFALTLFAMQAAAQQVGYFFGRRRGEAADREQTEAAGFVVGAILALLAFTMALTISFAQARFEERRAASLSEANAIGTAWLRARAVGGEDGTAIAAALRDYIALRRDYVTASADPERIRAITAETAAAQEAIWVRMTRIAAARPDPIATSLMASLNETFDAATVQRQAHASRLPREIVWLLLCLTLLSIGVIGYQFGLRGKRHLVLSTVLLLAWTGSLTLIADLSSPRVGDLRTSPAVYDWAADSMDGG
jgi:hypothetical protein